MARQGYWSGIWERHTMEVLGMARIQSRHSQDSAGLGCKKRILPSPSAGVCLPHHHRACSDRADKQREVTQRVLQCWNEGSWGRPVSWAGTSFHNHRKRVATKHMWPLEMDLEKGENHRRLWEGGHRGDKPGLGPLRVPFASDPCTPLGLLSDIPTVSTEQCFQISDQ